MPKDATRRPCPDSLGRKITAIAFAAAVLSASTPVIAAECEQVRAVINLIASVKMPFPVTRRRPSKHQMNENFSFPTVHL
jgi:hypothetical protein